MTVAELKKDIENLPETAEVEFYNTKGNFWVVDISTCNGKLSIQLGGGE